MKPRPFPLPPDEEAVYREFRQIGDEMLCAAGKDPRIEAHERAVDRRLRLARIRAQMAEARGIDERDVPDTEVYARALDEMALEREALDRETAARNGLPWSDWSH